ncbi:hypothetical protein CLV84_3504 [Neolewinella xylanilytica]|uniref:Thioredoxin domain-containing protein n=2 Tax=Neolewinella xylanilytica TaxID=1514080 RepID=A0A2S6I600_9BACT|nr:hypothetical protein CLV84_3504 [Neolewinella xylanilytica]
MAVMLLSCQSEKVAEVVPAAIPSATVSGDLVGAAGEFITLFAGPWLRGNLDPSGYRTQGMRIGEDGTFGFTIDRVTKGQHYALRTETGFLDLVLFPGDDLKIKLDSLGQQKVIVATGRGAGKINFQRLEQMEYDTRRLFESADADIFAERADSMVESRLRLLDAVYAGHADSELIARQPNARDIRELIADSPISLPEYAYLKQVLGAWRLNVTTAWMAEASRNPELANQKIDFAGQAFNPFFTDRYPEPEHLHDFSLANGLQAMLWVQYLHHRATNSGRLITYGNWQERPWDGYTEWETGYLRDHFSDHIHSEYVGGSARWYLSMGSDNRSYYDRLNAEERTAFDAEVAVFTRLLSDGTRRENGFEADSRTLDKTEFQGLLGRYTGEPLLINFWSATYAGSSIVDDIPLMQDFEQRNAGEISVINVCIDSLKHKELWAARVMHGGWDNAEHYFVPIEGNDGMLDAFSSRNLANFCGGGATQAIVDADGNIFREVDSPFYKLAGSLERQQAP